MDEDLAKAIGIYATQGLQQLHKHISSKSKEELQNMLEGAVVPEEVRDEDEIKIVRVVHGG